ncbi:MAG: VOC family protein [Rhodospirillales bacterium]|nr:VOC family protein [Rhodospirillales bacterium]
MAKAIHTMIRVLDEARSVNFYDQVFGMVVVDRFDFETFTLVYLRSGDADYEIELTINKDQTEPYDHGSGYGHMAFVVDDLEQEHNRLQAAGYSPRNIVAFAPDGVLMARFFFVADPDGYQIEILQKHGRYK